MRPFDSIEDVLDELRAGKPVLVVDDEARENEGDLICAAELATPETMAFLVRYSSGYVCVALSGLKADRLDLRPMVQNNQDPRGTAYAVTVDAVEGIGTGISARDRAHTARVLADPSTTAWDLSRPGHVVPLRARAGGVLERPGHTESAVDLMRLAGLRPAGVLCEVVSEQDRTGMARLPELREFANVHGLRIIRVADVVRYRLRHLVERGARSKLPVCDLPFEVIGYHSVDGYEQVALVLGDVAGTEQVPVRVHSECFTGDVLGSMRCDCGPQLQDALNAIAEAGRGVLIYLRGQEGRGIGLIQKLRAYELQDAGCDTVDANLKLGLPVDARSYTTAAAILHDLDVGSVELFTSNPEKSQALRENGIDVVQTTALPIRINPHNRGYLETKRQRLGHRLPGPSVAIGVVEHGDARGRTLGFPTANLRLSLDECGLADGVYGGLAWIHDERFAGRAFVAAISIGTNPTFAGVEQRFEVHLLDFQGDLYGVEITIAPRSFIRPTLEFDSAPALVAQIQGDLDEIRALAKEWHGQSTVGNGLIADETLLDAADSGG